MLKLQFKDRRQKAIWLVDEMYRIGRAPDNNLVIDSPEIAEHHAVIHVKHQQVSIASESGNSISVNGQTITTETTLNANDTIQIGKEMLEVIDPQSSSYQGALGIQPSQTKPWRLVATASWMTEKEFTIEGKTVIGRDPSCGIAIPVEHLSRKHAEVEVKGGNLLIKDLNSSNGTYLNGNRISEGFARPGDKIKLDVVTFVIEGPDSDPNKTIIRTEGSQQTAASTRSVNSPKAQNTTSKQAQQSRSTKPNLSNQRPLAAEKTQEWIQSKPVPQVRNETNYLWFVIAGFGLTLAVGGALYFLL